MAFILGNTELDSYLVYDGTLIPYMTNIKTDAKVFDRRLDALEFIETYEKMGFHTEYIHVLRMDKE